MALVEPIFDAQILCLEKSIDRCHCRGVLFARQLLVLKQLSATAAILVHLTNNSVSIPQNSLDVDETSLHENFFWLIALPPMTCNPSTAPNL